ncbi:MAG: hypothetical protein KF830_05420 [Planctomycetes bacterium]|nr:hypothetical protein [Planctomycetota bacterium]
MAATGAAAQEPGPGPGPGIQGASDGSYTFDAAYSDSREQDDQREIRLTGGFRFLAPALRLDVRGASAVLLADREGARALLQSGSRGLPRRGIDQPPPRRQLSPELVRERLDRTLRSVGRAPQAMPAAADERQVDLLRFLYFEGGVTVVRDGIEVLRCDRMWVSPLDDRIVVENAELRYLTPGKERSLLVVRGQRLVKQGPRWTGRDLALTTCTAAEPHFALAVGEAEIIEREGEFEVVVRDQRLQVGGASVLPLPDTRILTGSQSEFPIKRLGAGYSQRLGEQADVVFGLPYNRTGGAVHQWLTGRPAEEFRGEWELGVGWIGERGAPLEGGLTYRAEGVYEGRVRGFWLDDSGDDIREIRTNFDGSPIDAASRGLVTTENRIHLGPSTHLDLVGFAASDPAVYSEFFQGQYRSAEVPETSAYLHHADGNRLLTVGGRWNLDAFSYADNRALAPRFIEELPVLTYQLLAQPIGETPWRTPIVVDLQTEIGQRRSDYDDLAGVRTADRTLRLDQTAELSLPFHVGAVNVRPFASGRGTWYDNAVDGDSEGRIAFEGGVQLGTRLSRTWSWLDENGSQSVRHVIAPKVSYRNRFHVDDDPSRFFAFDGVDQLTERELVRVELRNLVQRSAAEGDTTTRDFVFLDLAQDFWPNSDRDNGGQTLGLLYYDLLIRPNFRWLPLRTFAFALYGDYDWRNGMRTLDTEVRFGPIAGITWTADYREDQVAEGALGLTARSRLLDRWNLVAGCQRDLQRDEWLNYTFGLQRDDHDWSIALSAVYNPFSEETTFRLEFLPRFGGFNRGRFERFGAEPLQPESLATSF